MEKVIWAAHIDVAAGPKLAVGDTFEVEAYDKVKVALEDGATDVVVDLQPGGAGQVVLLVVSASAYDPPVTWSPDAGTTTVPLDAPLVLVGAGAVGLIGTAPKQFQWTNATGAIVNVEILVGRDATP
jgi:hypothetical protein